MHEVTELVQHEFPSLDEQREHLKRLDAVNRIMMTNDSVWAV